MISFILFTRRRPLSEAEITCCLTPSVGDRTLDLAPAVVVHRYSALAVLEGLGRLLVAEMDSHSR